MIGRRQSGSLGFPYLTSFADLEESGAIASVDKVCAACLNAGIAVGVSTGDQATALEVMKRVDGHGWINMGGDLPSVIQTIDRQFGELQNALAKL